MPTSTQQIATWLTKLRLVHEPHAKRATDAIDLQNAIYADALRDLDARWLSAAVEWCVREGERFPKPVELRRKAEELQAAAEKAQQRRQIPAGPDPGGVLRNEVICILGDIDNAARRHYGDGDGTTGSKGAEYMKFLNEAATAWAGQRPSDQVVNGQLLTGYDLALRQRRLAPIAASLRAWALTQMRDGDIGTTPGGNPANAA